MSSTVSEGSEAPVTDIKETDASTRRAPFPMVKLGKVDVHSVTEEQTVQYILDELKEDRGGTVITPNIDHLVRCDRLPEYFQQVQDASLVVADGMPLIWASKLQGEALPERVAGSNLISSLSEGAQKEGRSLFLLGGSPGTAEAAAKVLTTRYEGLKIVGTNCPDMGFEKDPEMMEALKKEVCDAEPDIVFVALGSPKQENLIKDLYEHLPKAWWLGVGISFSFLCGDVQRAPRWMQKTGLEFLHRLLQEPKRLAKRYLVDGVPFAIKLLTISFFRRFRSRSSAELPKT